MEDVVSRIIYIIELYRELNINREERSELTDLLTEELIEFKGNIKKQVIQQITKTLEED